MRRALPLLLGLTLLAYATSASGQGLNDIPSPDEIRSTQAKPLRIDWPAAGDVVKVPFTVTGVAAPGARLELWVGGQLERKFIADANGRFNTAISKATDPKIEIRHVDKGSEPLATASVEVVFAGAAGPVAAADRPSDAEPAEQIDPFESQPQTPSKPEGLPRVSELGTGTGSAAPVPPPPSKTSAAFSETEGSTMSGDVATGVTEVEAPPLRRRTPARTTRYFAEAGVGLASGLVLGFGGVMLGGAIGLATTDGFAAIGFAVIGGLTGAVVGVPLGVVLVGNAMDGNGKWWAAVVGEVAGIALATMISVPYANAVFDGTVPVLLYMLLPTFGAAAGYELTSDPSRQDAELGARLSPSIGRTADGDMTFGFQLRF